MKFCLTNIIMTLIAREWRSSQHQKKSIARHTLASSSSSARSNASASASSMPTTWATSHQQVCCISFIQLPADILVLALEFTEILLRFTSNCSWLPTASNPFNLAWYPTRQKDDNHKLTRLLPCRLKGSCLMKCCSSAFFALVKPSLSFLIHLTRAPPSPRCENLQI